jgi:beta-lactamase class A
MEFSRSKNLIVKIVIAIFAAILLSGLVGSVCFFYRIYQNFQVIKKKQAFLETRKIAWGTLDRLVETEINKFDGDAFLVIKDLDTGLEIKFNENKILPSASLVKIPIMVACFYAAEEGKIKLGETIKLQSINKIPGSGILKHEPNEKDYSIETLIGLMVFESDNTAANMLIEYLGTDYLNSCFKRIGLKNTNISRKMMDFRSRKRGIENFTTSADMAYLLERIYRVNLLNKKYSERCLEFLKMQKIKDRIPARLPDDILVAHKTGLEKGLCHDAGIVFTQKGDYLLCVLTRHAHKTAKPAKNFIAQIALDVYRNCYM